MKSYMTDSDDKIVSVENENDKFSKFIDILKNYKYIILAFCLVIVLGIVIVFKATSFIDHSPDADTSQQESMNESLKLNISIAEPEIMGGDANTSDVNFDKYLQSAKIDWNSLQAQNPDVYAWILIPKVEGDTVEISYPILQKPGDDSYYLNHNIDGSIGYPGCIYTEEKFGHSFMHFNTIVYGHNMKNRTWFGQLHSYENKDFLDSHKYIYIYTEDYNYKFEVTLSAKTDDRHASNAFGGYTNAEQKQEFLNWLASNKIIGNDELVSNMSVDNRYVLLSTCNPNHKGRYLVLGTLVDCRQVNENGDTSDINIQSVDDTIDDITSNEPVQNTDENSSESSFSNGIYTNLRDFSEEQNSNSGLIQGGEAID